MKRTFIADVKPGEQVKIAGFVENCRNKKARAFLVIRDMTGKVQIYVEKEGNEALAAVVDQLTIDSVVTIEGECIANEYVKMGGMEIIPSSIRIESIADALPIKEDSAIDSRLDYRWVDLRTEGHAGCQHCAAQCQPCAVHRRRADPHARRGAYRLYCRQAWKAVFQNQNPI